MAFVGTKAKDQEEQRENYSHF